jgi:hypothetical protein
MPNDFLILCNRWHPIPQDYEVELHTVGEGLQIDRRILPAYERLMAELVKQGFHARVTGAYRTWELQDFRESRRVRTRYKPSTACLTDRMKRGRTPAMPVWLHIRRTMGQQEMKPQRYPDRLTAPSEYDGAADYACTSGRCV